MVAPRAMDKMRFARSRIRANRRRVSARGARRWRGARHAHAARGAAAAYPDQVEALGVRRHTRWDRVSAPRGRVTAAVVAAEI
jgi:hypothetical protein